MTLTGKEAKIESFLFHRLRKRQRFAGGERRDAELESPVETEGSLFFQTLREFWVLTARRLRNALVPCHILLANSLIYLD
jgi:hypothetical protein